MEEGFEDFLRFLTLLVVLFLPAGMGVLFLGDAFFGFVPLFFWAGWVVFVAFFLADLILKIKQ
jgi:hypothetical protein